MSQPRPRAQIGATSNCWHHDTSTGTFDLSRPSNPDATNSPGHPLLRLPTLANNGARARSQPADGGSILLDPSKTALVIIDMQNFFLSPALGRAKGAGHAACNALARYAVPAARKAGVRVVWCNWGLTEQEVEEMPPAIRRAFGFEEVRPEGGVAKERVDGTPVVGKGKGELDASGKPSGLYKGLGADIGRVKDPESGVEFDAGTLLMRDMWNSALFPPLDEMWEEGRNLEKGKEDLWVHKNRMSGLWGARTDLENVLENEGIKSCIFAGVNTDQCVSGTLTDAFSKGYDCILLQDGCGTTSPEHAQQGIEYNAVKTWGFLASCEEFARAVDSMR